jgi:nucleotide-binding universal stress UspA family protein
VRTILVGFDDSDAARRALDRAVEEARGSDARVVVLSVAEMSLDPQVPRFYGTLNDIADWEGQPLDAPPELVDQLARARATLEAADVRGDYRWAAGEPARLIADTARDVAADVVVLGEHHHSLLGRLFGEDVSAEVRRELGCELILA